MSDPTDQATVAPPEPAPAEAPVPAERGRSRRSSPARSRQAKVVLRKVGPWSVLKISFLFYLCVMVVILGAMMILYAILGAIGALDSLTRLIRDLFADQSFEINGGWLFSRMGVSSPFGGLAGVIFTAFIGAVVLLFLLRLLRRATAR